MNENKAKLLLQKSSLEFLPRLTKHLNGPKIFVKRDDEGGRSGGGNKLRKYERIIGDAIAKNCDTLIVAGHFQSNAARELVGSACQLGLKSVVVCKNLIPEQNDTFLKNGNALLMNLMGAEIVAIKEYEDFMVAMENVAKQIADLGRRPYIIPFGGSNLLGSLGYVDCVDEIKEQVDFQPDYIYTPIGSGGTQAGLIAGVLKNEMKTKVIGVSVLHKKDTATRIVENLTNEILNSLELEHASTKDIVIDDGFIGVGYGVTTNESLATIKLLAQLEGVFLCPVYTAKAMTGLIAHIKAGKIKKEDNVIFIHTGGSPLIYAYYDKLFE